MTELWTTFANMSYDNFKPAVEAADRAGYDGIFIADSPNISPELWVLLSQVAALSSRLKMGSFVTTPLTRHPAATASAAATLQEVSGGRVVLGVGRGDSSHAYLGYGPMKLGAFERYISELQAYLKGESVDFVDDADLRGMVKLSSLDYGTVPTSGRIRWLPNGQPKVPVDVAGSGPKVIATAAREADGLIMGLGADRERLQWGIDQAHAACREAGRDPSTLSLSALIFVGPHTDRAMAQQIAAGPAASIGRWQSMQGAAKGNVDKSTYDALDSMRKSYDMTMHGESGSSHASAIGADQIARYAIYGTPDECIARVQELKALGLKRMIIPMLPTQSKLDVAAQELSRKLLREEVIPAVR